MLWCDMVKTWCYILLYEMIMFCNRVIGNWQEPYGCRFIVCNASGSDSRRSNSWRDDNDATMEIMVSCRWRWKSWRWFGDGDQKHTMMMAISWHILWLHVMFIFYTSYFALFGGSIIRWSLTKFQGTSVLPEYASLPKFVVPRHHVMIGCDKLYVHLQRVQASFAHAEYSG